MIHSAFPSAVPSAFAFIGMLICNYNDMHWPTFLFGWGMCAVSVIIHDFRKETGP